MWTPTTISLSFFTFLIKLSTLSGNISNGLKYYFIFSACLRKLEKSGNSRFGNKTICLKEMVLLNISLATWNSILWSDSIGFQKIVFKNTSLLKQTCCEDCSTIVSCPALITFTCEFLNLLSLPSAKEVATPLCESLLHRKA